MVLNLIGSLVRAQRAKNLSNRRVALAIGVSPSAMSHYISGSSTPSLEVLLRWAEFIGVQISAMEPHLAEVAAIATLAEELTREELHTLELSRPRADQHPQRTHAPRRAGRVLIDGGCAGG